MRHRRLQRHHSRGPNSAFFGVAFNPVTSKWSALREATLEVLSAHASEPEVVRPVAGTRPRSAPHEREAVGRFGAPRHLTYLASRTEHDLRV